MTYLKQPFGDKTKEFTWFWGYRTHVLISGEGIPLVEVTLPNNRTDGKVAKALLKKIIRVYGQKKGRIFLGDAGYDDRELYNFIVEKLKAEPFIPLNPRGRRPDKTLGSYGLPLCPAGLDMKFNGISPDTGRTRKKFRCRLSPERKRKRNLCHHNARSTTIVFAQANATAVPPTSTSLTTIAAKFPESQSALKTLINAEPKWNVIFHAWVLVKSRKCHSTNTVPFAIK